VFVRNEGHGANASGMRVLQEALPYLGPYLQSGRISVGPKDLHLLLQSEHVALEYISPELAAQVRPKRTSCARGLRARARVHLSPPACRCAHCRVARERSVREHLLRVRPEEVPRRAVRLANARLAAHQNSRIPQTRPALTCILLCRCYLSGPLLMCGWRGHKTTQLLVNKKERARMLALFNTVLITPPPNVGKAPAAKRAGSEAPSADDQPEAAGDATPAESVAEDAMPVEDVAAA